MNILRSSLLVLIVLSFTATTNAQKKVMSTEFFGLTIDLLYWNDVEYMCSQTPLAEFENYKNIFGKLSSVELDPESPVEVDKNYQAKWAIINDMLCLYDVEFLDGAEKYPTKYKDIEKLTGEKFNKDPELVGKYPEGVIQATWFSGFICIKRQPKPGENYCDCHYRCENFKKLEFRKGKLAYIENASSVDILVNDVEIFNQPEKYRILYDSTLVLRVSPCRNLLKDKLSITDNQIFSENFSGHTIDKLFLNDTEFMCSESPLSELKNYTDIYPEVPFCEIQLRIPVRPDKNYAASWIIVNDILYFCDIDFICVHPGNKDYDREYPKRFEAIEKLTGTKLQQIPATDKKGIPATWFSGTLYIKQYPQNGEYYSNCNNICEPYLKVEFENGKVKSTEETSYMIVARK